MQKWPCPIHNGFLNLIKDVEDIVEFLTPKVFNSENFFVTSFNQETTKLKNEQQKNRNIEFIYIHKVVISVCLSVFVCLSDHASGTPKPICLKF